MKKLLLLLICILCWQNLNAQVTQREYNVLVNKVDSLEHELALVQICMELSNFDSEVRLFISQLRLETLEINQLTLAKTFDKKLSNLYNRSVTSSYTKLQSYIIKYKALSISVDKYKQTLNLNELDKRKLDMDLECISQAFDLLEHSFNIFKSVVSDYNLRL